MYKTEFQTSALLMGLPVCLHHTQAVTLLLLQASLDPDSSIILVQLPQNNCAFTYVCVCVSTLLMRKSRD